MRYNHIGSYYYILYHVIYMIFDIQCYLGVEIPRIRILYIGPEVVQKEALTSKQHVLSTHQHLFPRPSAYTFREQVKGNLSLLSCMTCAKFRTAMLYVCRIAKTWFRRQAPGVRKEQARRGPGS